MPSAASFASVVPVGATPDLERWLPLRQRGVRVDFPFFLAPMVGLSHVALRQTVASYLPEGARTLLFTEMLSSRRLPVERIGDRPETARALGEDCLVPQLLGNEERFIAGSLVKLRALAPAAVDINMGCPVSKALKHNWGVALMGDAAYAEEVVRITVRLSPWPVSVKLRTGLSDDPEYLIDFARMLEGAGAAWITVHPRFAAQGRRGFARWEYIARVRDAVRIPVIGNGDVQTAEDALAVLARTGCDGVMIGWPTPGLFRHEQAPRGGFGEGREFERALRRFLDVADGAFSPPDALKRLKFFSHWGGRWLDFGHELWRQMANAPDTGAAREAARRFFSTPQRMAERTALAS
jgi:tRNA-dihydrouridine synthase B